MLGNVTKIKLRVLPAKFVGHEMHLSPVWIKLKTNRNRWKTERSIKDFFNSNGKIFWFLIVEYFFQDFNLLLTEREARKAIVGNPL